jgi:hypothetical protein
MGLAVPGTHPGTVCIPGSGYAGTTYLHAFIQFPLCEANTQTAGHQKSAV